MISCSQNKRGLSDYPQISIKHRFRKVIVFPTADQIFITFNKVTSQIHMLNTVALKQYSERYNQFGVDVLNSEIQRSISDKRDFGDFHENNNKEMLDIFIEKLQNEIREEKILEKYPSRQPEIIAFYMSRNNYIQKLKKQKQSLKNCYEGYSTDSQDIQTLWSQILKEDLLNDNDKAMQSLNFEQQIIDRKRNSQMIHQQLQNTNENSLKKRHINQDQNTRTEPILTENNPNDLKAENFQNQMDLVLIKNQVQDMHQKQTEYIQDQQSRVCEVEDEQYKQQPSQTQNQDPNSSNASPGDDILLRFIKDNTLMSLQKIELSKLCIEVYKDKHNIQVYGQQDDGISILQVGQLINKSRKTKIKEKQIQKLWKIQQNKLNDKKQSKQILIQLMNLFQTFQSCYLIKRCQRLGTKEIKKQLKLQNQNKLQAKQIELNRSKNTKQSRIQENSQQKYSTNNSSYILQQKIQRFILIVSLFESIKEQEVQSHQQNCTDEFQQYNILECKKEDQQIFSRRRVKF